MSIRDKTDEVVERGREARGEYDPAPGSLPLKAYLFWKRNTKHARKVENFCHYWRVVFIWAPLMVLRVGLRKVGRAIDGLLPESKPETNEQRYARWAKQDAKEERRRTSQALKYRFRRAVISFFKEHGSKVGTTAVALVVLGVLTLVGATSSWLVPLYILAGAGLGLALLLLIGYIAAERDARRQALADAAEAARWAYYEKHGVFPPYVEKVVKPLPVWIEKVIDFFALIIDGIAAVFRGIGQLFVLAAQAVRVSKWKICPLVKIPGEPEKVKDYYTEEELRWY